MSGRPRKQLPMSDEEIRREFLQARDPKKQLKILADENCCSVGTILRIVNETRKQEADLSGFVPIQELVEKVAEEEKDMIANDPAPATPTAEPEWPPLPSAPPQAAADFDESGPSTPPDAQDLPDAGAAEGTEGGSVPHQSPSATASPGGSREDAAARWWPTAAELQEFMQGFADTVPEVCFYSPESGAEAAAAGTEKGSVPHQSPSAPASPGRSRDSGNGRWVSGKDLSRMWHILGRLQGVLEASAAVGKPAEVMKGACDELEVLLMSLGENDPF